MKNIVLLLIGVVTLAFTLSSFTTFESPYETDDCIVDVSGGSPWACEVTDGWTCNGTAFTTCDCTVSGPSCSPEECDTENPNCTLGGGAIPIGGGPNP